MATNVEPRSRLIPGAEINITSVAGYWYAHAAALEDALLAAGAEPGKDYTRLDLFKLTQPTVTKAMAPYDENETHTLKF